MALVSMISLPGCTTSLGSSVFVRDNVSEVVHLKGIAHVIVDQSPLSTLSLNKKYSVSSYICLPDRKSLIPTTVASISMSGEDASGITHCMSLSTPPAFGYNYSIKGSSDRSCMRQTSNASVAGSGAFVQNLSDGGENVEPAGGDGGSSDGGSLNGRGGGGDGGGEPWEGDGAGREGEGDDQFGPILDPSQVEKILAERGGLILPADMDACVQAEGIPSLLLERYLAQQAAPWPLGWAIRMSRGLRDRMLADPSFLFKVFTEVAIDSCCATFAEVQKRGKDFWKEFDLYVSDLAVGLLMDVALVSMLAPTARFGAGRRAAVAGVKGAGVGRRMKEALAALPNNIFEVPMPGQSYSVGQRVATYFVKGLSYGATGFTAGLIGQSLTNSIITLKRSWRRKNRKLGDEEEEEVKMPNFLSSAVLWGGFMGVSSNTRYQVITGLERAVESSALSRSVPLASWAFTIAIRLSNNIYGGMQFVDWARLSGVQ
eukprot:TRINITY_DN9212_c0_g1_i1.p1 TRINITY_DN9212_c0_g1~~TRINITY_DN9212_c0_g1_i1.p1  ORF type:complete len:486 (-),score=81.16 TRINITY_DN9212_c0_g1_i1:163-1620(-)